MRVLLVQPWARGKPSAPPLGLGYLAAVARQAGHEVKIVDNELAQLSDEELKDRILQFSPDTLGITSHIMSRSASLRVAELVNSIPYVVFGGPQPTLDPVYYLKKPNYFVLRGEGEVSFVNFLRSIEDAKPLESVLGLSFKDQEGQVMSNPPQPYIRDISQLPYPTYDLLPMGEYKHKFEGEKCATMITTRGCPFKCVYCYHILNTKFRYRTPEHVIGEVRLLQENYGFNRVKFFDDVFTLNRRHTANLCQAFIDHEVNILWQCLTRVDCVSEDLLRLMYKSGCRHISFGVESGNQKTLDRIRKRTTVEKNRWALETCRKVGIRTKAYIIIGFPWETKDDIRETIKFVEETVPDFIQVLLATPMPNTDMDHMFREEGIVVDREGLDRLEESPDLIVPTFEAKHWTQEELIDLYHELHERYFAAGGRGAKDKLRKQRKPLGRLAKVIGVLAHRFNR